MYIYKYMKDIENLNINYCGISNPENQIELDIEILGLEYAIKKIEARICFLKQSFKVAEGLAINKEGYYCEDKNELYSNKNVERKGDRKKD